MKVLHISPTYFPATGGAELHLKKISEALVCRGHEVTVLTFNVPSHWDLLPGRDGHLPKSEIINGVNVIRLSPQSGLLGNALASWVELKGGWRSASWVFGHDGMEMLLQGPPVFMVIPYILSSNADIVASMNWYWRSAYHTYLARRLKRFTMVGIPLFHAAQAWCERPIYKKMLASCDAVLVNTSHEKKFVQQRGATRAEVTGVGINPTEFEERRGDVARERYGLGAFPVVGFVGRQIAKKGVLKLIESMQTVWDWNKEVRLVLAGPRHPKEKEIERRIETLSESQKRRIINIGSFEEKDKASLFDAFDVFALPSKEESFGIAYLEAWACGKPVLGARMGATRCVINDGVDGLLVDPDDAEDIARAIVELLSDRDKREKMGRSGHDKTMARYTWDKVTDRVERLYLELAAARPAGPSFLARARRLHPWTQ